MNVPLKLIALLEKLRQAGSAPTAAANGELRCCCPAHDDQTPSLYLALTQERILLHCKAGCTTAAICDRLDFAPADLFIDPADPVVDPETDEVSQDICEAMSRTKAAPAPPAGAQAPPQLRHAVYTQWLAGLELNTLHFDALRARGLTVAEINTRGYRSADPSRLRPALDQLAGQYPREQLLQVPGFVERDGRLTFVVRDGLLIPVRNPAGELIALKVRHDGDRLGARYTWASSAAVSCGSPVHVPLGVGTTADLVRLTEGELKADVTTVLSGLPTISAPGVSNWHLAIPVLHALAARQIYLALDQDGKPGTRAALRAALFGLRQEGFAVQVEWWDGSVAKGIDDLLASGGQPELLDPLDALLRLDREAVPPTSPAAPALTPLPCPLDVLPPLLARLCREVAEATSSPPDYALLTLLTTAGAAIGTSRALCVKKHSWYESPRIYGINVGDPSSGKSPAMQAILGPYINQELSRQREHQELSVAFQKDQEEYEQQRAAAATAEDAAKLTAPQAPVPPERSFAVDYTVESLAPLLQQSPRGLLVAHDEGAGWVQKMNEYKGGKGSDRQFWLSIWSGTSLVVDRKSQGPIPVSIPRPFVNVICGLPPDMLSELADRNDRRDGFLDRILFVMPPARTNKFWTDATVTPEAREAWARALTGLRCLRMEVLSDGFAGYREVQFSPEAHAAWVAWYNDHATDMESRELAANLQSPFNKLKSYAARLTLLLHYLWLVQTLNDEGDIQAETVERAVRLITYFKSHLRLVYDRLQVSATEQRLARVQDWVRQNGGRCGVRDLLRGHQAGTSKEARAYLNELVERGLGHWEEQTADNRRKVPVFVSGGLGAA
ncbi:MAG: DUF3987 domain-containing protein [Planctomycetia bacterium]|nr:DUF3987 domain-containing protein [Planctomycetia bacterium]